MIEKLKTKFGKNPKRIIILIIAFYCIKGTTVLLLGGYAHSKGWTSYFMKYWYVSILVAGALSYFYYRRHKRKTASKTHESETEAALKGNEIKPRN